MRTTFMTLMLVASVSIYAECVNMPLGMALAKTIEAQDISQSKTLLLQYKKDVAAYLKSCNNDKDKFEETSVMIHTYEARLEDVEHDMNKNDHGTDCSMVPNSVKLEQAFKNKNDADIKMYYANYKKNAEKYIEYCATDAEYETVYESAMFCDEMYDEWMQKNK